MKNTELVFKDSNHVESLNVCIFEEKILFIDKRSEDSDYSHLSIDEAEELITYLQNAVEYLKFFNNVDTAHTTPSPAKDVNKVEILNLEKTVDRIPVPHIPNYDDTQSVIEVMGNPTRKLTKEDISKAVKEVFEEFKNKF